MLGQKNFGSKKMLDQKTFGVKKKFGSKKFLCKKNCTFCPLALSAVGPFVCFYNVLDLSSFGPSVFCTKRLLYQASFVPSALWTIRLLYHVSCTKCLWTKCLWTNCPGTHTIPYHTMQYHTTFHCLGFPVCGDMAGGNKRNTRLQKKCVFRKTNPFFGKEIRFLEKQIHKLLPFQVFSSIDVPS